MLNQSFAVDNFETIYDIENRKRSITGYLGKEYKEILSQIKALRDDTSRIKRKKSKGWTEEENKAYIDNEHKIKELVTTKKEVQHAELEKISNEVNNRHFKFDLQAKNDEIFVIQDTKEAFFAIKQLQYNVRKTFKVKQSSRHLILSQIKLLLNDNTPKYVIRTDVSKFFESIPQDKLLKKINDNTLLSFQSKRFIKQILEDYNNKKDRTIIEAEKGVPRGVGISSYLSELYMKDIDRQICKLPDVVYYARYVDDIFIIISPSLPKRYINSYFVEIKSIIEKEELSLHTIGNKCNLLDLSEKVTANIRNNLTYLGYEIYIEQFQDKNKTIKIRTTYGLSQNKKNKIEKRILKIIEYYNQKSKYDIKTARKELLLCLRFLCSNTKLSGAKSRVKTGIFYSNDLLDKVYEKDIKTLDNKLKGYWLQNISPYANLFAGQQEKQQYIDNLKNSILTRFSFSKGFINKTYHYFSQSDLKTIKRILQ
jgi:hypothetical protein